MEHISTIAPSNHPSGPSHTFGANSFRFSASSASKEAGEAPTRLPCTIAHKHKAPLCHASYSTQLLRVVLVHSQQGSVYSTQCKGVNTCGKAEVCLRNGVRR